MTPILSHHLSHPPLLLPHSPSTVPTTSTSTTTSTTNSGLQFRSKIVYLESLSINSYKALNLNPALRTTPLETLIVVEETLTTSFNLPHSSLGRILDMFPQILTSSPSDCLIPVSHFLQHDVALSLPDVSLAVERCPRLLVSDVASQLRPTLLFLRRRLRLHITAQTTLHLVSNIEHTLIPKLDFLKELGFEEDEVVTMVQRSPAILTYSIEKNLTPKIEYFLKEMKGHLNEIWRFPQYFSFSLEGKIKPRHRLLEEYGIPMSLKNMLKVSDGEFDVQLLEMRVRRKKDSTTGCVHNQSKLLSSFKKLLNKAQ